MTEPRYQTRVGDPDETMRIPREALEEFRGADRAKDGSTAGGPPTGSVPAQSRPAGPGGLGGPGGPSGPGGPGPGGAGPAGPAPRNGSGVAGGATAAVPGQDGRTQPTQPTQPFRPGPGTNGSGVPPVGPPAGAPLIGAPAAGAVNGIGSPPGYRRSETGYSPSAYPNPAAYVNPGYGSLGDAPTAVVGAAAGTAAARSALGAATAARGPGVSRPSAGSPRAARPPRRARLLVRHIDPWSTLKFSFVLAVAMFFVWLVAVGVLYGVLDGMGVFEEINGLYDEVSGNAGDTLFSPGLVLGTAALIGVVNIVLFTALATIGAFVYNICSDLVGGIEVTLAERD